MKVVVSGAGGFVGTHLVAELVAAGHSVVGVGLGDAPAGVAAWHEVDLAESWPVEALAGADAVVHLAALAAVGGSFEDPQAWIVGNSAPLTALGEVLLSLGSRARVLFVSSGAVYAPGVGLTESSQTEPSSPYAISKLVGELQAGYYRRRGLDVVTVRPFNHLGPGQASGFLLPDLVASVESAREGDGTVRVGDLTTRRDYTDVRDVTRAYRLLLEAPDVRDGVFNVCSGATSSGRELLDAVLREVPGSEFDVLVDQARVRPNDPAEISGDASRLRALVGWKPQISIEQTVRDFVAARGH